MLSGGEAVQFFQKSGLPRSPTLFKIWQYVAGDRPSLTRQEFYTAMKLVSAAQRQQGVLDDSTASLIVNGLAGAVPPPQMQGLEVPLSLVPGGGDAGPEGRQRHVDAARGGYPVLGNEKAISYQTAFDQLDLDGDGLVKGGECFGAFMQSGLSKGQLKLIWDVVAGNEGSLNRHQFIQCLYLIDCAKMNIAIPTVLPEGQFPPMEQVAGLQSMMVSWYYYLYMLGLTREWSHYIFDFVAGKATNGRLFRTAGWPHAPKGRVCGSAEHRCAIHIYIGSKAF